MSRRGFTLVEMLVAVLISAIVVVAASQVATVVFRSSNKGEQRTDLALRSRIITEQLRDDIRSAGLGSTGAVGVDPGVLPFSSMFINTPVGGYPAIPVVAGANNTPVQALPGGVLAGGSDALQLVVANPGRRIVTDGRAAAGANSVDTLLGADVALSGCDMVLIHDHTSPNGSGRTQLAVVSLLAPTLVTITGSLLFSVAPGSEVTCARISTYWLDDEDWLHRTDLLPGVVPVQIGATRVFVTAPAPVTTDIMAPAVESFQVSYRVSSEAYRQAQPALPLPAAETGRWAFIPDVPNASGLMTQDHLWFEVRLVRATMYLREQRALVLGSGTTRTIPNIVDGDDVVIPRAAGGDWVTTAEAVASLQMFDSATAADVPAEPY